VDWLTAPPTLVVLLAAAALVAAVLQLAAALSGRKLPGCGPGSACDEVTTGRWSRVGPLPVALPGASLYLAMLAAAVICHPALRLSLAPRAELTLAFCAILATGAAVWFTALQALVIRRFCRHCLFTHALAVTAAVLALRQVAVWPGLFAYAVALLALLVLIQMLWAPDLHTVTPAAHLRSAAPPVERPTAEPAAPAATPIVEPAKPAPACPAPPPAPGPSRRLVLVDGRVSLSPHLWPVLGDPQARHLIIDQFDYTCHYCRDLHGYLRAEVAARSGELAVVLMPLPLESRCNRMVTRTHADHRDACIYAQYALAVFRAAPEKYVEYEHWLLAPPRPPPIEQIKRRAAALVGEQPLAAALADAWLVRRHNESLAIYEAVGQGQLPKLLLPHAVVSGPIRSRAALAKLLQDALQSEHR
jgi:uncharacterized membrane protein